MTPSKAQCSAPAGALLHGLPAARSEFGGRQWHHAGARPRRPSRRLISHGTCRPLVQASRNTFAEEAATDQTQRRAPPPITERTGELVALLQDIGTAAIASGPTGVYRAWQAAQAAASVATDYLADMQRGVVQPPPRVLRRLFERLGSTYIKLGQFVASSPTIFPAEYVEEMQALLDRAPPVPWPTIRAIIEEDLGMPLASVFSSVEEAPLATASIAQVHRAVHRESGKDVVIKVLKPGVEDLLGVDLQFLEISAKILQFIDPSLERTSLVDILGDIRLSMMQECDFRSEARNIATFSSYLDQSDLRRMATAPFVYSQLTSKRVLVMEYLEGTQLTDLAAIQRVTAVDPEQVLINALNVWFGSVVDARCTTFHADLHAGNLLVMDDGRVGFIDFGIVGTIAPSSWQAIQALASSAAVSDFETIAAALATVGATRDNIDVKAFGGDLQRLFEDFESINPASLSDALGNASAAAAAQSADQQVNSLLLRVVAISESYGVRFPREFGLLLKQILYLDRYTRILAPTLNWVADDRVDIGST